MERICDAFERSPGKTTRRASRQLEIPQTTVWRGVKRRSHLKTFKLSLVRTLANDDKVMQRTFCESKMKDDEILSSGIVLIDEATFHLNGKVNRHN